ncbi:hypothetical protein BC567DRAFT_236097 [Phyllosticta citribraziliensis]
MASSLAWTWIRPSLQTPSFPASDPVPLHNPRPTPTPSACLWQQCPISTRGLTRFASGRPETLTVRTQCLGPAKSSQLPLPVPRRLCCRH